MWFPILPVEMKELEMVLYNSLYCFKIKRTVSVSLSDLSSKSLWNDKGGRSPPIHGARLLWAGLWGSVDHPPTPVPW